MTLTTRNIRHSIWLLLIGWVAVVLISAAWSIRNSNHHIDALARAEARSIFFKDVAFRAWATEHGGVYVPVTEHTQPNRYLAELEGLDELDLVTPSRRQLTLMNPAYMMRQLHEDYEGIYGAKGRITSLKPLNPDNEPDAWERQALVAFEQGEQERVAYVEIGSAPYLRMIRPLEIKKGCLKCHEHQGYQLGDIRGGIGVNVPLSNYYRHRDEDRFYVLLFHLFTLLLGAGVIILSGRRVLSAFTSRLDAERRVMVANTELRASEAYIHLLMDTGAQGVIGTNRQGECIFINQAAQQLIGVTEQQAIGRDLHEFLLHTPMTNGPTIECPHFIAALAGGPVHELESQIRKEDGSTLPVEFWLHAIKDEQQATGVLLAFIDISERLLAEQTLQQTLQSLDGEVQQRTAELQQQIMELNRTRDELVIAEKMASLGRMVFGLAHEINTPLGVAVGGASHLAMVVERLSQLLAQEEVDEEELLPLLEGMKAASQLTLGNLQRAAALVARMRRTSVGHQGEPRHRLSVQQLLTDCLGMQGDTLKRHAITTHVHCPEAMEWFGRAQDLCQVVVTLVDNSIRHGLSGQQPERRIEINVSQEGEELIMVYSDNGGGIDEALRPHLFEPFAGGMRTGAGSGLGLFITFNLVTVQMHGSITYEPSATGGVMFTLRLPLMGEQQEVVSDHGQNGSPR